MSAPRRTSSIPAPAAHLDALSAGLDALRAEAGRIEAWGRSLAAVLLRGGRLLAAGNGGSAAEAQHLTAELVGRYLVDRPALSAIALHAEPSALTAITNDYGAEHALARQLMAHGRPGDVFVALSTSGRSENVLAAARAAAQLEIVTWALTGPAPNPLAEVVDDALCVPGPATPTVQELHLVAVHLLCGSVEAAVAEALPGATAPVDRWPAPAPEAPR
jgi:D-sedoheptulose 7-phosphate isomerase